MSDEIDTSLPYWVVAIQTGRQPFDGSAGIWADVKHHGGEGTAYARADIVADLRDRLEAAEAERDRLREALRPFVEYVHDDLQAGMGMYTLQPAYGTGGGWIGAEDLRRARAALKDAQEGQYD